MLEQEKRRLGAISSSMHNEKGREIDYNMVQKPTEIQSTVDPHRAILDFHFCTPICLGGLIILGSALNSFIRDLVSLALFLRIGNVVYGKI